MVEGYFPLLSTRTLLWQLWTRLKFRNFCFANFARCSLPPRVVVAEGSTKKRWIMKDKFNLGHSNPMLKMC